MRGFVYGAVFEGSFAGVGGDGSEASPRIAGRLGFGAWEKRPGYARQKLPPSVGQIGNLRAGCQPALQAGYQPAAGCHPAPQLQSRTFGADDIAATLDLSSGVVTLIKHKWVILPKRRGPGCGIEEYFSARTLRSP